MSHGRILISIFVSTVTIIVISLLTISKLSADHSFGTQAGFSKAKAGETLQVWSEVQGLKITDVIAPWNNLAQNAGRKTPLFTQTATRGSADIEFVNSASTWVQVFPCSDYNCNYTLCRVYSSTPDTHTMRHEIGHCLGFADHVWKVYYGDPKWINPKVCDDPSHPAYSPYKGVMSYCDWNYESARWFKEDDRRMLIDSGYVAVPTPTPTPTPKPSRCTTRCPSPSPSSSPSPSPTPTASPTPSPSPTPTPTPSPSPKLCRLYCR